MTTRYYIPGPLTTGEHGLEDAEAHHLLHVMRAKPGQKITLFDGLGAEADAVVTKCERRTVTVEALEVRQLSREALRSLHLGVALPKGDRQKWLVEKVVELGAASLTPLITARGVAQPTGKALDRLARSVVEASKQCGRNTLMAVQTPQSWEQWLADAASSNYDAAHCWIAMPGAEQSAAQAAAALDPRATVIAAIGAEGGFADTEVRQALDQRWSAVCLGRRVLRIETAAVALSALICANT